MGERDDGNRARGGRGPVLIELGDEGTPPPDPADAPPLPDAEPPQGAAMQAVAALGARRGTPLGRFFWGALAALIGFVVSVAAWDFVTGLIARSALLGWVALALVAAVLLALIALALREAAAIARLGRLDAIHRAAAAAHAGADLKAAREAVERLERGSTPTAPTPTGGAGGWPSGGPRCSTPTRCSASPRPNCWRRSTAPRCARSRRRRDRWRR